MAPRRTAAAVASPAWTGAPHDRSRTRPTDPPPLAADARAIRSRWVRAFDPCTRASGGTNTRPLGLRPPWRAQSRFRGTGHTGATIDLGKPPPSVAGAYAMESLFALTASLVIIDSLRYPRGPQMFLVIVEGCREDLPCPAGHAQTPAPSKVTIKSQYQHVALFDRVWFICVLSTHGGGPRPAIFTPETTA
jgi:hypothetical protein